MCYYCCSWIKNIWTLHFDWFHLAIAFHVFCQAHRQLVYWSKHKYLYRIFMKYDYYFIMYLIPNKKMIKIYLYVKWHAQHWMIAIFLDNLNSSAGACSSFLIFDFLLYFNFFFLGWLFMAIWVLNFCVTNSNIKSKTNCKIINQWIWIDRL